MLRLVKMFNNNVALADDGNEELIVMGRGIAFQKKPGDVLDETKVEKRFSEVSGSGAEHLSTLLGTVPPEVFELSEKIISDAEQELQVSFDPAIHVGLTDHICEALNRCRNGQKLHNVLLHEIAKFYPKEFAAARHALETIYLTTFVQMEDDEAGFIAMHFVNSEHSGEPLNETIQISKITEDILKIVELTYRIKLDPDSLNWTRFITHIQYFARRMLASDIIQGNPDDDLLYAQVRKQYPKAYECALKIKEYIEKVYGVTITNEEMTYFMIHINRAAGRSDSGM